MRAVVLALYCETLTVVSADRMLPITMPPYLCLDAFVVGPCHYAERNILISAEDESVKATYAKSIV